MHIKKKGFLVFILYFFSAFLFQPAAQADLPRLIPRETLFGNPTRTSARISPDGTRLAYLAPSDQGVLNVWVRTVGKQDDTMVTHDTHRGIRIFFWGPDGNRILYLQDFAGNENWHVYAVDLSTRIVRDLTPFQGIRAQNIMVDRDHPDQILVGLNLRDRRVFDMYRVDLKTGAVVLDTQNPGDVLGWLTDDDFVIRGAVAMNPRDGSTVLRVRDAADTPWRDLITWPFGEQGDALMFTKDGKGIYVLTTLGSDTQRLDLVDLATGNTVRTLAVDPRSDISGVLIHPERRIVQAVRFNYLKPEWKVLDPDIRKDFDVLRKVRRGSFSIVSRDHADHTWVVAYSSDDSPTVYYVYDRRTHQTRFLFATRPELEKYQLARMEPVIIRARDGLPLVSYLTLPVGVEPKNLPMVLLVHGGPWARDTWGFDTMAQWLANRGYAVLQVNFRGSAGFGKKFLNAGNGEWGRKMQDDLTDAVHWAIEKGIADPERVAIMGGSYGGYATLAGVTFTPDLYSCGVDIVGPSHIKTLFRSIPPYWAPFKKMLILRVGDVEKDEELNRRISPLFHVNKIRVPLLIGQGANDPRVNINESNQIVEALRKRGLPVTYVVYTDEGHGFARPENRLDFYGRAEEFLAKCLGGRAEPWKPVPGSSAELR